MSLLGKVALKTAKVIGGYVAYDIASGNNKQFNKLKKDMQSSHNEKIQEFAAGRMIIPLYRPDNKNKAKLKDSEGNTIYVVESKASGKEYLVCDHEKNLIATIDGSSSTGRIKFPDGSSHEVHLHESVKGSTYTVIYKKPKEKYTEKRSLFQIIAGSAKAVQGEETGWKIESNLTSSIHKYLYHSTLVGESKSSYSLVVDVDTYLFVENMSYVKSILLFMLAQDIIRSHRIESDNSLYTRRERTDKYEEKTNNNSNKSSKKEKKSRREPYYSDFDFDYDDDND